MVESPPLIAVVDDEEGVRRALGRLLRSSGFAVASFATGSEFLDGLATVRPDCVVLDLHMPKMDGFVVLSRMAEMRSAVPAVIITGHDTPENRERAERTNAAGYLRKPVDDELLLQAIQASLSGLRPTRGRSSGPTSEGASS